MPEEHKKTYLAMPARMFLWVVANCYLDVMQPLEIIFKAYLPVFYLEFWFKN